MRQSKATLGSQDTKGRAPDPKDNGQSPAPKKPRPSAPDSVELEEQDSKQIQDALFAQQAIEQQIAALSFEIKIRETRRDQLLQQWQIAVEKMTEIWKQVDRIYGLNKTNARYRFDQATKKLVRAD